MSNDSMVFPIQFQEAHIRNDCGNSGETLRSPSASIPYLHEKVSFSRRAHYLTSINASGAPRRMGAALSEGDQQRDR